MQRIKLSDYVAQRCVEAGYSHVFLVTGGGAMHLNDSFGRNKKLIPICFHHEQAAAMAAESYYRTSGKIAVLNVTTGPGGINALNGVFGAYVDSQAMFIVSGQVKNETYLRNYPSVPLRQLGDQEVDIISMSRCVVKYSKILQNPSEIGIIIDKAMFLATHGRPGPVWIDIPIDMQAAMIDPDSLQRWDKNIKALSHDPDVTENTKLELRSTQNDYEVVIDHILEKLSTSVRPVLFAGAGVRIANQVENFLKLASILKIPTVTGWNAHDILHNDHECYAGKPGTVGDRAGNFTVQNSDLLIVLGSRLNIRQISYNFKNFASRAYKIIVDIDQAELDKPTLTIDYKVLANLQTFVPYFLDKISNYKPIKEHLDYLSWCKYRVKKYPVVSEQYHDTKTTTNPYVFVESLIRDLNNNDVIVTGNGSACVIGFQTANIKKGQRLFTNSGDASMGYDLPASIGACLAIEKNRVICLAGDGSLMMNLQELQTIVTYRLPIKILVLNNDGYASIKQTQNNYFSDNVFGTDPSNGVGIPDFTQVAHAFGIPTIKIKNMKEYQSRLLKDLMECSGPALIEVMCDPNQVFAPKLAAQKLQDGTLLAPSLENMSPFLSQEEMKENYLS